jgi:hypothetical protein
VPKKIALRFLALASPAILIVFVWPVPGGGALFTVLAMAFPVALIVLGGARGERLGPLGLPLLLLLAILELSSLGMLFLRGRVVEGPWLGGLPLAAALQIYGLWLGPLVLVALAYALTFDRFELREEDLERLRKIGSEGEDR